VNERFMRIEPNKIEDKSEESLYKPKTSLGKRLLETRSKIIASGEKMLDWKDIEREVANRRGGYENRK
jgi:hypothetical protein